MKITKFCSTILFILVISGCAVKRDYKNALKVNNIATYIKYQKDYPQSKYREDIQKRLTELKDETAWDKAIGLRTLEGFRDYLSSFPTGKHIEQAEEIVLELEYEQKLNDDWERVNQINTIQAYEQFNRDFPNSEYYSTALEKIASLRDYNAWDKALKTNTIVSYNEYIANFPNGNFRVNAQEKIKEIDDEKYRLAWEEALKKNTFKSYLDFSQKTPYSKFTKLANDKMNELQWLDWNSAKFKNTIDAYSDFILKYPLNFNVPEAEKRIIDLEVEAIFKADHGELPPLTKSDEYNPYSSTNTVSIFNNTDHTLTIRYSGNESKKIVIAPKGTVKTTLKSDMYKITASVDAKFVRNYAGEEYLTGGEYEAEYYIVTGYGGRR